MQKISEKEFVWVKLKTRNKLAKMFEQEQGTSYCAAPLSFAEWSTYIPECVMGRAHRVVETHTYYDDRLYKIYFGGGYWWVSEKFISRKYYVLEVDFE